VTSSKTLAELADFVGGKVIGDSRVVLGKVATLDQAGPGDLSFLTNPRYRPRLAQCRADAIIVGPGVAGATETQHNFLECADPYLALARILQLFSPDETFSPEISPLASVHPSASVGERVTIFPFVFVGPRARVGEGSVLHPGVYLGADAQTGAECVLYPNVVVRAGCRLADRVILHAGVVIGSDGFGYAGSGAERSKIPQLGIVVVEDDVEIGANTTVDRATLGQTVIGRGSKIDNLVQIAHNVEIGEYSVIAAQTGIAGSSQIGRNVTLAGQVGVVNHIKIGDGAIIGPQSGVGQTVPAGAVLSSGITAAPHSVWRKVMVLLPQLPKLWNNVRLLEKQVARLTAGGREERKPDDGR
jgi:UDP-3-O-[3-hydroxymyristoyl] glucosamine N-acyltransferase